MALEPKEYDFQAPESIQEGEVKLGPAKVHQIGLLAQDISLVVREIERGTSFLRKILNAHTRIENLRYSLNSHFVIGTGKEPDDMSRVIVLKTILTNTLEIERRLAAQPKISVPTIVLHTCLNTEHSSKPGLPSLHGPTNSHPITATATATISKADPRPNALARGSLSQKLEIAILPKPSTIDPKLADQRPQSGCSA